MAISFSKCILTMIKINDTSEMIQFDRIEILSIADKAEKNLCYDTTKVSGEN